MKPILLLARLIRDTRGATALEYGFLIALLALAALSAIAALADRTTGMWEDTADKVEKASLP